jgi:hypothetical protein
MVTLLNQMTISSAKSPELTDEDLQEICEFATVIACECPAHLATLVRSVRKFRRYTADCIQQFPEDTETHEWLQAQAAKVEDLLTATVFELMRREELLNDRQELDLTALAERSRAAMLKYWQPNCQD